MIIFLLYPINISIHQYMKLILYPVYSCISYLSFCVFIILLAKLSMINMILCFHELLIRPIQPIFSQLYKPLVQELITFVTPSCLHLNVRYLITIDFNFKISYPFFTFMFYLFLQILISYYLLFFIVTILASLYLHYILYLF